MDGHRRFATTDVAAGKEWKRIYLHGQAQQDFAAGKYDLSLHLGTQAQTLEFGGIAMLNLGPNVDVSKLPFTPITYPGQEPDAPWRKAAAERIEKHRKGDLTVRVVDKDGKPVAGAKVHVQMQRHAYGFGTFLEYEVMLGSGPDADKLREWTLKLFNRCTTPIYLGGLGLGQPGDPQEIPRSAPSGRWTTSWPPAATASSTPAGSTCPRPSSPWPRTRPPCRNGCSNRWPR